MIKQTCGSWSSVRNAAEMAPIIPPVAWQDQVNVLRLAEPFLGSFLAWITISESIITSVNAIDSMVRKVQIAAKTTLLSVNIASVNIDRIWTIAPTMR